MSNSELRDKVMELAPYPEDLKDRIREKIAHTRERPLKGWERLLLVFFCAVAGMILIGVAIWIATDLDTVIGKTPTYMLVGFALSVLLLCGFLVSLLLNLKRGAVRSRNEHFMAYAAAGIVLYIFVAATITGKPVTGVDLGAMIVLGVCVVCACIQASELRLREHMLRNELALANLTELIADRKD